MSVDEQPVSNVVWIDREKLWANDYNPNKVAPPELKLLKISILEDGWTLPLVIREDGEIVDGFHRWTLSKDPEIHRLTNGKVPVVTLLSAKDRAHQIASTIRYNRARGTHYVVSMADIVAILKDDIGLSDNEIMHRFGMESEEVSRLYERGNMRERGSRDEFNKGWVPTKDK